MKKSIQKKLLILLMFSLIIGTVNSAEYEIDKHEIIIDLDKQGKAKVTENFVLSFPNSFLQNKFGETYTKFNIDIAQWTIFDQRFRVYIGGLERVEPGQSNILFTKNGGEAGQLTIEYILVDSAVEILNNESRFTDLKFNNTLLNEFIVGGSTYSIPEDTSVQVLLPKGSDNIQIDSAAQMFQQGRTTVIWGNVRVNDLKLEYRIFKQIAPVLSIASLVRDIIYNENSGMKIFFAGAIVLLFGIFYWRRKNIEKKLANFAENHSMPRQDKK